MQRASQAATSNRLGELRSKRQFLRSEIAGALKVDQSTLWRWEKGAAIPDHQKLALAELLDVSVAYLMGWPPERTAA